MTPVMDPTPSWRKAANTSTPKSCCSDKEVGWTLKWDQPSCVPLLSPVPRALPGPVVLYCRGSSHQRGVGDFQLCGQHCLQHGCGLCPDAAPASCYHSHVSGGGAAARVGAVSAQGVSTYPQRAGSFRMCTVLSPPEFVGATSFPLERGGPKHPLVA